MTGWRYSSVLWFLYGGLGAVTLAHAVWTMPRDALVALLGFVLACLMLIREQVNLESGYILPASVPIQAAALFVLPAQGAVILAALVGGLMSVRAKRPLHTTAFNVANTALPILAGALVYGSARPDWRSPLQAPDSLLWAVPALVTVAAFNTAVIVVRWASLGVRPLRESIRQSISLVTPLVVLLPVGIIIAMAYPAGGPWALLVSALSLVSLNRVTQFYAHKEVLFRSVRMDGLTGVRNRLAWEEQEQRLSGGSLSAGLVAVLDLNGLKLLNDSAGHQEGDRAIRGLAACLVEAVGSPADVYRYGGDEFLVFLESPPSVGVASERIIQAVEQFGDEWEMAVSASLGIAAAPLDGATLRELFQVADRRMYEQKRSTHPKAV